MGCGYGALQRRMHHAVHLFIEFQVRCRFLGAGAAGELDLSDGGHRRQTLSFHSRCSCSPCGTRNWAWLPSLRSYPWMKYSIRLEAL